MVDGNRLRVYSAAVLVALGAAVLVAAFAGTGADTVSGRLGGDFPAFYGAGSIVLDGNGADLYDPEVQQAAQQGLTGDQGYLYFAYPPVTALGYAPLAALPFRVAYVLHSLLMMGAVWLAFRLIAPMFEKVLPTSDHVLAATALALVCYPLLRAVLGGQNTALSILLLALVMRLFHDERYVAGGVAASMMLYKPQFGVVVFVLVLLTRKWRALPGWVAGAAVAFAAGVVLLGPGWTFDWIDQVSQFDPANQASNGHTAVSALGWWRAVVGGGPASAVLAAVTVAAVGIPLGIFVYKRGLGAAALPIAAVSIPLVAPYAMYYDAGLAVLAPAAVIALAVPRARVAAGAFLAASWLHIAADQLLWTPLFVLLVVMVVWVWAAQRWSRTSVHSAAEVYAPVAGGA